MIICVCKNIDCKEIAKYKAKYPDNWKAKLVCQKDLGKTCGVCCKYLTNRKKCDTMK